ncbi:MAG: hypothetical protein ACOZAO_05235 [Patescibacteria group bacterium]
MRKQYVFNLGGIHYLGYVDSGIQEADFLRWTLKHETENAILLPNNAAVLGALNHVFGNTNDVNLDAVPRNILVGYISQAKTLGIIVTWDYLGQSYYTNSYMYCEGLNLPSSVKQVKSQFEWFNLVESELKIKFDIPGNRLLAGFSSVMNVLLPRVSAKIQQRKPDEVTTNDDFYTPVD